jgi:hypothetical protein
MTPRTPLRLTDTELRAAALDGELLPLGGSYLPLDVPLDPRARLTALAPALGDDRVIIAGRCAAWVWGWTDSSCPTLCCCVSSRQRIPSSARRALAAREVVIDLDEIVRLDSVAITTPLRTLLDLARHDEGDDLPRVLVSALQDAAVTRGLTAERIDEALRRRPGAAHTRRARARLERAAAGAAQPLLTR